MLNAFKVASKKGLLPVDYDESLEKKVSLYLPPKVSLWSADFD